MLHAKNSRRAVALGVGASLAAMLLIAGCGDNASDSSGNSPAAPSGAGSGVKGDLTIKGSDTMVNLVQAWVEAFQEKHPDADVSVTGGGSGTGIAALSNHTTDIAMSSRDIKDSEKATIEKDGGKLQEFKVAQDALTVGVHPSNPVKELTIAQLSDIYAGKITDWKDVGGKPGKIVALSREKSSGTHVFFLEEIVRRGNSKGTEEFAPTVLMMPASKAIVDEIAKNPQAIGYYGLGYHRPSDATALGVKKDDKATAVEPTEENVLNGSYPISRPLFLYVAKEPEGVAKAYIEFAQSDEGQKLVVDQHFVPMKKAE